MCTDMLISTFFREVKRLYPPTAPFTEKGVHNAAVEEITLPPYRAVFSAACLKSYTAGYRLPSLDGFLQEFNTALRGKTADKKHGHKLRKSENLLYEPDGRMSDGLLYRLSRRYADGMAHTQLYCVLAQAYEDQRRLGAVFMDARTDIKLKTDIIVTSGNTTVRIDIGAGNAALLKTRRDTENRMKQHASGSSERGNPFLDAPCVRITRNPALMGRYAGLEFFTGATLDPVFREIDDFLHVPAAQEILYRNMVGITMSDLNRKNV